MRTFGFRVVLAGLSQASEGMAHALYEAGCTDSSVASNDGVVAVTFEREAMSLDLAMLVACDQVESAGYEVARVELVPTHLLSMADGLLSHSLLSHAR